MHNAGLSKEFSSYQKKGMSDLIATRAIYQEATSYQDQKKNTTHRKRIVLSFVIAFAISIASYGYQYTADLHNETTPSIEQPEFMA